MVLPLVSVVTPTWRRHDDLLGLVSNLVRQTYRPLEHVVVSDGPDDEVADLLGHAATLTDVPIRFVDLGRNWSSVLPDSFCAAPLVVGQLVARGAYQMFASDDERFDPDHVASLTDALEAEGADFAYGRVRMWWAGRPEHVWEIGTPTPQCGQITNALYRSDLLAKGLYPFGAGMTSDWACISMWLGRGARAAFVDRATMSHRVDH